MLVALRELPTHLEEAREVVARVMVPGNQVLASYLEARIAPERADRISSIISVRALIGMVVVVFLTQEILGAGEVVPVSDDDITTTIAELFLRGVAPPDPEAGEVQTE
jgi:hypothetical protein